MRIGCVAALLFALIFSCANQSPPGGGPPDKTPPELVSSRPQSGEVNVDPGASVIFHFSEWISAQPSAVTIYPRPKRGFDVRVVRNRLEIKPKDPLEADTTYLVVVSTSLKDLRNNPLPERITLMFSTGNSVNESVLDVLKPKEPEEPEEPEESDESETSEEPEEPEESDEHESGGTDIYDG